MLILPSCVTSIKYPFWLLGSSQPTISLPQSQSVGICSTTHMGLSSNPTSFSPRFSPESWQSWPWLFYPSCPDCLPLPAPLPCGTQLSPYDPGRRRCSGWARWKPRAAVYSVLLLLLLYGYFTLSGKIITCLILGSWSANNKLYMQAPSCMAFVPKAALGESSSVSGYLLLHHAATLVGWSPRCCFCSAHPRSERAMTMVRVKHG